MANQLEFVRLAAVNEIVNQRHHNAASHDVAQGHGHRLDQSPSQERFSAAAHEYPIF